MKKYKILWIDDQFDEQDGFIESAYLNDIEINAVKTSKQGMIELENNLFDYDGVILDAKVFDESEHETANKVGLHKSIYKIKELNLKKVIPYYIFTGQPDLIGSAEFRESVAGEKVYNKLSDHEILFNDIIENADKLFDTNLRHKYSKSFSVFEDNYIDKKYRHFLIEMLTCIEKEDYKNKNLTVIRKLLESLYVALIEHDIHFSDTFLNQHGNPILESCTRYMEKRKAKDNFGTFYQNPYNIPKNISASFRLIIENTNLFSHINENEILKNTFLSSSYAMLQVLDWLPDYINENIEM